MEKIKNLTTKIKYGHVMIRMNLNVQFTDDMDYFESDIVDAEIVIKSDEFQKFLDSCVGTYSFDIDQYSITFTNTQDYVNYLLVLEGEDCENK